MEGKSSTTRRTTSGSTARRGHPRRPTFERPRIPARVLAAVAVVVLLGVSGIIDLGVGPGSGPYSGQRVGDLLPESAVAVPPAEAPGAGLASSMDWVPWSPSPPEALAAAGFAANASSGTGVLFGGASSAGLSNATFVYSEASNEWTSVHPASAPSARSDFGLAADDSTNAAILFGGRVNLTTNAVSNATWLFDLGTDSWASVATSVAPAARQDPAFAVGDGVALLYGGWAQNVSGFGELTYSDTWEFNLTTLSWSEVHPAGPTPGAVHGASLLWQPTLQEFLLFGGCYPCSSTVWSFSPGNQTWHVVLPVAGVPPPRMNAVWLWDPAAGVDVLFGGTNGTSVYDSTYYFQPSIAAWTLASPSAPPSPRFDSAADFLDLPDNATVLLAGGSGPGGTANDVWRLSLTANLTVKVTNATSGLAVVGATVQVGSISGIVTNATGFGTAYSVPATVTVVTAVQAGYASRSLSVWIAPASNGAIQISLTPVASAEVEVAVTQPNGVPVPGANVSLSYDTRPLPDSPMLTNGLGDATFPNVPAANYTLEVSKTGYHTSTTSIDAQPGARLTANVTLSPFFLLAVQVRGRLPNGTELPLPGAEVFVDTAPVGLTGPSGQFNRSLTQFGLVDVAASLYGFDTAGTSLNVTLTGTGYVNLTLVAQPYPTITIEILGQRGNGPGFQVRGANVSVVNSSVLPTGPFADTFLTNVEGTVTFSPPTGNYSVRVSAPGFVTNSSIPSIVAPPGANLSRTYYLSLIGFSDISVIVLSTAAGNPPVGGALVGLRFIGTNLSTGLPFPNESGFSRANGFANFSGVPQAKTLWSATATGYLPGNGTFQVVYGSPSNRFTIYLIPIPPPKYTGLHIFPLVSNAIWTLLLLPIAVLVGALVYLTVLRNPSSREREIREEAESTRGGLGREGRPP